MSAAPAAGDQHAKEQSGRPELRGASLSALEEAVRRALDTASRGQVLQRVLAALPAEPGAEPELRGKVRKVSVSMPADLSEAVRARAGAGGFSRYVSDAVQDSIRHDLLGDLLAELEEEYGPVPDEIREQTRRMWPDEQDDQGHQARRSSSTPTA